MTHELESHLMQSHFPIIQRYHVKTDRAFVSELIRVQSLCSFDLFTVTEWDVEPHLDLIKRLIYPSHIRAFAKWLLTVAEEWSDPRDFEVDDIVNSELFRLSSAIEAELIHKSVSAIQNVLLLLRKFSVKSLVRQQAWALSVQNWRLDRLADQVG